MSEAPKLTGQIRYRLGFRSCLVLQVQVKGLVSVWSASSIDCEWKTWWRDATVEDIAIDRGPELRKP